MGNWQRMFDRRNRPAWVVLLVCFSLTLAAWYELRSQAMKGARQQFDLHAQEVVGAIEERLRQHQQILLGGAGLFDASDSVSRAEWRTYIERLRLGEKYPGVQGVGFSQVIRPGELKAHIAAVRAEGFPDYTVRPAGERALYTSIVFLEPFSGRNLVAFGYDMMSEATRAQAMHWAVDNGKTSISGKVRLVQETHDMEQPGFLMYLPVYRRNLPLITPEQRWKALRGFVYSPYRAEDLMQGIVGGRLLKLDFAIFDGGEEVERARLYASGSAHATPPEISARRVIHAYGRDWTVRLDSRPEFEAEFHSPLTTIILALGGGISGLLFYLVSFLIFRRERADELAQQMTEEIRRNEGELRRTKQLLDSVIENIPTMVFLKRAEDLRFELFNRAGEKLLGYSRNDLIGKNDYDFFPKEEADFFVAADRKVLESQGILELPEEPVRIASGETRYLQTWKIALRDENGRPTHLLGISIDITERKNAAESIARISNLNRAIVDGADHLIITTDTHGVIQSFNRAAEKHLGYRAEELIGKLTPGVFHDTEEVVQRARELNAAGITVQPGFGVFVAKARQIAGGDTHEWTYVRKDGSRFPVLLTVTALRDGQGGISAYLGIATDITERRRAEEELRKLSRAIEQSPVSVVITDADGDIEYVNAKFSEVTGYAVHEVIGRNPRIVQSGLTPMEVYRSMWQTILAGQQWRGKLQNRKRSGELFWEEIHISAIRDSGGRITHFVAVKEDITERMQIERMKNEFISTVSHELRTPLTSIRGSLALIAGGVAGELPAAAKPLIEIAHNNSERLILLVNDILDMEKIEAGRMEFDMHPVEIMTLLRQALEANRTYAGQYQVVYELEGDLPGVMVNVDANRLMQVLANLLSNAAKFSPPGGRVAVAATLGDGRIRVAVSNQGSGVPEQFRSRIFQKFAQADSSDTRRKGGTGLGLSITKAMVEQMGGSIGFDSQPDVLTTFFVEFPVWQEAIAAPAPPEAGGKKRVLICEDDRDIAALLRMMLEQAGIAVDVAYNAGQAKQMLAQGSYAAMTLDLDLPDQNGIALIHELRSTDQTAGLPIVVVSASAVEGSRELDGEAFSIVDWIGKPINQEQLVGVLRQIVRQAHGVRPRVLHIEDDPDIFRVVNAIAGEFAEVNNAASLAEARRMLENNHYDLAILDISLPDDSGMKLLPLLNGASPPVPVLVFSAREIRNEDMHKVKAALVKSRTSNEQLLATIKRLIGAG